MPAIASITWNPTSFSDNFEELTHETIREIGSFPHVERYIYEIGHTFYSTELQRYINSRPDESWGIASENITDSHGILHRIEDGHLDRFYVTGVSTGNIAMETELIRIVAGRNFEERELQQGIPVVLISEGFARTNELEVGSTFTLDNMLYDDSIRHIFDAGGEAVFSFDDIMDTVLVNQQLEVTVIGLFEVLRFMDLDYLWQNIHATQGLLNSIFIPSEIVAEARSFINAQGNELISNFRARGDGLQTAFQIDDPRNLSTFLSVVNDEVLGNGWEMGDLSENITAVLSVLETKELLASSILYGIIAVTVSVLVLLVSLSVRDRRNEIGIYLALGEKKLKIIKQIVFEFLMISILALSLGLLAGNLISESLSTTMLQSELVVYEPAERRMNWASRPPELWWFDTGEVALEDVVDFDFSLSLREIKIFYGIGAAAVLLGSALPLSMIVRLNPKEILM